MERIRKYCVECSADHKPGECTGELLGAQKRMLAELLEVTEDQAICPMHRYRMGKNPKRVNCGNAAHLKRFRFAPS